VAAQSEDFVILACTVLIGLQVVTDALTDRQANRQTDRQTDRQTPLR